MTNAVSVANQRDPAEPAEPRHPAEPAIVDTTWFRGVVDGLRAVAILLVVAYHAGVPGFSGGFIGVDVFFVISGFLISRNLLRESETTRRVALSRFWARRIRRLVPAMALVVALTLIVGYQVLPLFDLRGFSREGAAASVYLSNIWFAIQSQNYLAADTNASPFLHTWSLGVEEQFYVVWPLVFVLARRLSDKRHKHGDADQRRRARRRLLIVIFSITLVSSLALSVWLTAAGSTWAFFGLPSRAWEFAVAGLLAILPLPRILDRVAARTIAAVTGLGLLVLATLLLDESTAYPGFWPLIPVGGTVLLILAGDTRDGALRASLVSHLAALRPLQWLGRVSYSWYLWHWPVMTLATIAVGTSSIIPRLLAGAATLPVAWLSYRFFETPLRFSSFLTRSSGRTFAVGAAVTALLLGISAATLASSPPPLSSAAGASAAPGASVAERVALQVELFRARSEASCPDVGGILSPDRDAYCEGGDLTSSKVVMLVGDSHGGQWRAALETVAKEKGVKLVTRQRNGCIAFEVRTITQGGDLRTECIDHRSGTQRLLAWLKPVGVIVANRSANPATVVDDNGQAPPIADQHRLWGEGVSTLLRSIVDAGARPGLIIDEPSLLEDPIPCLLAKEDARACEVPRAVALTKNGSLLDVEREAVAAVGNVATLDMTPLICDAQTCRLEIDGRIVYVDSHHLSDEYTRFLLPQLRKLFEAVS